MNSPVENIAVLGLGNWGTALAAHLARKGHSILGWSNEPPVIEGINQQRHNPAYFPGVDLGPNVKATGELKDTLSHKIILMVIPSSALRDVVPQLKLSPGTLVISALKGLERETLMTPLQFLEKNLTSDAELAVLSGPSFAIDIINSRPSGVVSGAAKEETARKVADIFSSPTMKVYVSTDPIGVEIGGIAKNVIAIAVGVCDGLTQGDSARAGIVTRGLAEITRLAVAMGADQRTLAGLSGLGDLVMTATCDTSRNRTVGLRLGRGETLQSILGNLGSVAEGVSTAELILKLAAKHNVEMPITTQVARLVKGEVGLKDLAHSLLSRPTKREF